ncbi:MAG: XdhC family protein [Candidatus Tyrphobacter sp.]
MREIYAEIARRLRAGERFAVATLVQTREAKASMPGTSLVVDARGAFAGDIGAGCHEGTIVERAVAMLAAAGAHAQRMRFDLDDELLIGSGCGASLDVVLWMPVQEFAKTADAIAVGTRDIAFTLEGSTVEIPRRLRLAIVGATALAAHLTGMARRADFIVTIVDPRPPFASRERHPQADEIVVGWPDDASEHLESADAICVLSHDVKIDLPALRAALATHARYVGLLGNRRVQRARREALRAEGYDDERLARVFGPTGLDVGAQTDGQTAVSILAEILAVLGARPGTPLRDSSGSIH